MSKSDQKRLATLRKNKRKVRKPKPFKLGEYTWLYAIEKDELGPACIGGDLENLTRENWPKFMVWVVEAGLWLAEQEGK